MVKAQVYLKAGKTKKSEVLDDFCEGRDTAGDILLSSENLTAHGHLHPDDET